MNPAIIQPKMPIAFKGLFSPMRYKVYYGGRGSAKSWSVAEALIILAYTKKTRVLCAREIQLSIDESVIKLLADRIHAMGLTKYFEIQRNTIKGYNGSVFIFSGLRSNITKIKSMEGIDIVWCEEAEKITRMSWEVLIPTIRKDGSEIWVTFNPSDEMDNTYQRFVIDPPHNALVVKVNHDDNPFFPEELRIEMEALKKSDYDLYLHVWEGECLANVDSVIIHPAWVSAAIDAHKTLELEVTGSRSTGLDVADGGPDANAIADVHGFCVTGLQEWHEKGGDVIRVADIGFNHCADNGHDRLVFDSIGVGAGVKARTNQLNEGRNPKLNVVGFNAGGAVYSPNEEYVTGKKNKDMFSNIKAQMWWQLRDRFHNTYLAVMQDREFEEDEIISLDSEGCGQLLTKLKSELSRPRVSYDKNGKVKVESKEEMKKRELPSPNIADAVVMGFVPMETDTGNAGTFDW